MGRPLAFQETAGQVFEFSARCQQGRFLLTPGSEKNRRIVGVLARSLELYGDEVKVHFGGGTSNHLHLLLSAETAQARANLKRHFKGNVSVAVRDLLPNWSDGVWGKRSRDIAIADDALEDRCAYISSHGVKENLVSTTGAWPGIQFVRAVTEGTPLKGVWYDRTKLSKLLRKWRAKRKDERGAKPGLNDVARQVELPLARLPQLEHLTEEEHRAWWVRVVEAGIEAHAPATTAPPKGPERILAQDPEDRPLQPKQTPAPMIHTRSPERRREYLASYRAHVEAYYRAQDALRATVPTLSFPIEGCLPAGVPGNAPRGAAAG